MHVPVYIGAGMTEVMMSLCYFCIISISAETVHAGFFACNTSKKPKIDFRLQFSLNAVLRGGRMRGIFLRDGGSGSACPGFPCAFSGWEFLSRMAYVITGCGTPSSGIHAASD